MPGPKVPTDPAMSPDVRAFLEDLRDQADTATSDFATKAGLTQTDFISGFVGAAIAQDYRIIEYIPYGATITGFTGKTSSGTLTATLKIYTTAITTGALSVTSAQSSVTPTALNVMSAGDVLVLTASAISTPVNFSFTVKFTRTLAA